MKIRMKTMLNHFCEYRTQSFFDEFILAIAIVSIDFVDVFHVFVGVFLEKFHYGNGHSSKRFDQIGR